MKLAFSTLACPDWTMPQIIAMAAGHGYDGIELRFVQGEDSLWKLPVFSRIVIASTLRALADNALVISCLDTSCRFHSPDPEERKRWLVEGDRMSDLAHELGAPALRVFGDTIQPGADRASTQTWIADSLHRLAEIAAPKGVEIWIENHGDFATARETASILAEAQSPRVGVVWDPANSFVAAQETSAQGAAILGDRIRHVHIKDMQRNGDGWKYTLTGEGELPLLELRSILKRIGYEGFLSFEWEKKWHPEIADAEIALPHFVKWFRNGSAHG